MKRQTDPVRFRKKLSEIKVQLMKYSHNKNLIPYTISVARGYMNYFAVNDNKHRIGLFLHTVKRILFRALNKRSHEGEEAVCVNSARTVLEGARGEIPSSTD